MKAMSHPVLPRSAAPVLDQRVKARPGPSLQLEDRLPGLVAGAATAMVVILAAQALSATTVQAIAAALFAQTGLLLVATVFGVQTSLRAALVLAAIGVATMIAALAGISSLTWTVIAGFLGALGGMVAIGATEHTHLFRAWSTFHAIASVWLLASL